MSSQSSAKDDAEPEAEQQAVKAPEQPTETTERRLDAAGRTSEDVLIESRPTVRPTLVWMGITITLALVAAGYVANNPSTFGGPETTRVLLQVIAVIGLLILIRLMIKVFVLTRTTYRITNKGIAREYTLFLRTQEQEVPVGMVRSSELRQSRVQKILGYGTIEINRGLGALTLENVDSPDEIREALTAVTEHQSRAGV